MPAAAAVPPTATPAAAGSAGGGLGHPLCWLLIIPVLHAAALAVAKALADDPRLHAGVVFSLYAVSVYIIPLLHWVMFGPQVWVDSRAQTVAAAPVDFCSDFLRRLPRLPLWMQQVRRSAEGPQLFERRDQASVHVDGGWWGLPWSVLLRVLHPPHGGLQLVIRRGVRHDAYAWLPRALRVDANTGVSLGAAEAGQTQMLRFEQVGVPVLLPLAWLWWWAVVRRWHQRSVEVDTGVLRAQVELAWRLHAADADAQPAKPAKKQLPAQPQTPAQRAEELCDAEIAPARWREGKYAVLQWLREFACRRRPHAHPQQAAADAAAGGGGGAAAAAWRVRQAAAAEAARKQRRLRPQAKAGG